MFQRLIPFPPPEDHLFTFIDLFAGIGGFRLAFQRLGGRCVFSSEWNPASCKTYSVNFGEMPYGDITRREVQARVPTDFDLLCAGFPCQPFSIAGQRRGFEETRGTLFFNVAQVLSVCHPKAFFLENVKGLVSHKGGATLQTMLRILREELGYRVPEPRVINAKDFGVPQNRERVFIVGFREDAIRHWPFHYPAPMPLERRFIDVREKEEVSVKYYLSTQYIASLQRHRARHAAQGHGFGYEVIPDDGIANAVLCGGMGRERNLVVDMRLTNFTPVTRIKGEVNRDGLRRMTPREWARLQGFPDDFRIVVSDTEAYRQFGNSVAIPAVIATGRKLLRVLGIKSMPYGTTGE